MVVCGNLQSVVVDGAKRRTSSKLSVIYADFSSTTLIRTCPASYLPGIGARDWHKHHQLPKVHAKNLRVLKSSSDIKHLSLHLWVERHMTEALLC